MCETTVNWPDALERPGGADHAAMVHGVKPSTTIITTDVEQGTTVIEPDEQGTAVIEPDALEK